MEKLDFMVTTVAPGLGFTNKLYFNPEDIKKLKSTKGCVYLAKQKQFYGFLPDSRVPVGSVALPQAQLVGLNLQPQVDKLTIDAPGKLVQVGELVLLVIDVSAKQSVTKLAVPELEEALRANLSNHIFSSGQRLVLQLKETALRIRVEQTDPLHGTLTSSTLIRFDSSSGISLTANPHSKQTRLLPSGGFDFKKLGIGGLDAEFEVMFTDAFAIRLFDPIKVQEMGLKPVKGIILHGPPGTGKTTIAKRLGELLNCVTPIVKSGPELMDKFVGSGEKMIRELFVPAEEDWEKHGVNSQLHLIIIDEIDAIARARGASNSTHTDSLVNQLLTKMDGVKESAMSNFLVIGMTNRLSLLDRAFLRPGRFELQLEIGLPDEDGRLQILDIHTTGLRKGGKLAQDVELAQLAKETKNYTGSEIEGLVRRAAARALSRLVDPRKLEEKPIDLDKMEVTKADFDRVLLDMKPMFGTEVALEKTPIIVPYGAYWEAIMADATKFIDQVRDAVPFFTLLIEGGPGTGKTALQRFLAKSSGFPFLRVISPSTMSAMSENINRVMEDAYRVNRGIVLFEHIERLFSYTPVGPSFSNQVLQALMTAFTEPLNPPKGNLLVIATTSKPDAMQLFEIRDLFNAAIRTRNLSSEECVTFLQSVYEDKPALLTEIKAFLPKELPVRTLYTIVTAIKKNPTAQEFLFNLTRLRKH